MESKAIRAVFLDELERNKRMTVRYEKEIESLPKGSLFKRKIGSKEYFYLTFRNGEKVVSRFLGNAESFDCTQLKTQLSRRKELQKLLRKLKAEKKELEKELK